MTTNTEHSASKGCVLVVDDNVQVRRLLSVALETAGFDVVEADTQFELQRRLAFTQPDVLLVDLQQAETDGLALLLRLRARQTLHDVPIIFLAGDDDDDDLRWQAVVAGADWFAVRPLSMVELQTQVGELIRTGRRRSERAEALSRRPAAIRILERTG
jgi:DNA-binding response OmpR family regulator